MNNKVKMIEFQGDELLAVQENSEKIYVSVAYISDGIGLSEGQKKRQVNNVRKDEVLSQGIKMIRVNLDNVQNREVLCIELDFLPLWLAKISITPKMKTNNPEMVDKLINYQIKAKEVLANAFVHNVTQIIPKTYKESLQALIEQIEENEKLMPKAKIHDQLVATVNVSDMAIIAKNIGIGEYKLFEFLRETKVLFKQGQDNVPYQQYQNDGYFKVKVKIDFDKYNREYRYYTTKVTGKGKIFIAKLVDKYGGAEVINNLKLEKISGHVKEINQQNKQ